MKRRQLLAGGDAPGPLAQPAHEAAACRVPDVDRVLGVGHAPTGGDEVLAVRCEEQAGRPLPVLDLGDRLARPRFPQEDAGVHGGRQSSSIGGQSDHADVPVRRLEALELTAARRVPELGDAVAAARRHELAIGRARDAEHAIVAGEHVDRLASVHVPDLGRPIRASGNQRGAVGGKGEGVHAASVSVQPVQRLAGRPPQVNGALLAAAGENGAVRGDGHCADRARMANRAVPKRATARGGNGWPKRSIRGDSLAGGGGSLAADGCP